MNRNPFSRPTLSSKSLPLGEHRSEQATLFFLKCAGLAAAVFLIAALFLFREIQHSRELYQMGQLVTKAEAQKRQWQEKQRVEETRAAGYLATLHSQRPWSKDVTAAHPHVTVAMHWH